MEHLFAFVPVLVISTAMIALRLSPLSVWRRICRITVKTEGE